jgi:teichuronic acid biosynthesis glycosyltransferase TuaG
MADPLVSIVIAAFNAEPYLAATLKSVQAQTYPRWEAIVVDDASPDKTREVARAFAATDSRIRLVTLDRNSGRPAVPRNRGLAEARGELVAFLDADDLWAKRKLEDQVSVLASQPDLVLVYSMVKFFGQVNFLSPEFGVLPLPAQAVLSRESLEVRNAIACLSVLAWLEKVRQVGGFDESPQLKAVEDYDLWLRLSRQGPIGFIPRIHGYYRVHPGGISRDREAMAKRVRYVLDKNAVTKKTRFGGGSGPSVLARNVVHLATMPWIETAEIIGRTLGRGVPLRRDSRSTAPKTQHEPRDDSD